MSTNRNQIEDFVNELQTAQVDGTHDRWSACKTVSYIRTKIGEYWDGINWLPYAPVAHTAPQVMFPLDDWPLYQLWDEKRVLNETTGKYEFAADRLAVDGADFILEEAIDTNIKYFNYRRFKELAVERGQYYRPVCDVDGVVTALYDYYGTKVYDRVKDISFIKGSSWKKDFNDDAIKGDIIFLDYPEGIEPSNFETYDMCQYRINGGPFYTKGILYVCGDLVFGGLGKGSTPEILAQDPDEYALDQEGTHPLLLWHQGIVFTSGEYQPSGKSTVYGAVITRKNYTGSGATPWIYYDPKLKDGEVLPFSSSVIVLNWESATRWNQ
jgi:hypothetical protein